MPRRHLVAALAISALMLGACGAPTPSSPTAAPAATAPAPATATAVPPTPGPSPSPTAAPTLAPSPEPAMPTAAGLPTIAAAVPTPATAGAALGTSAPAGPSPVAGGPSGIASARAAGLDPDAVAAAFTAVTSFRASIEGQQAGQHVNGTIEVVLPDHLHISALNLIGSGQTEMIVIGDTAYVKSGGTDWQKLEGTGGMASLASLTNPGMISQQLVGSTAQVTRGETATVRGVTCQQYRAVDQGQSVQFCIGADNLPHQIVAQGVTIQFYDYNADITIQPPIS